MLNEIEFNRLFKAFQEKGQESLKSNHYALPAITGIGTPTQWKEFLQEPKVNEYILQETEMLAAAELRTLLLNVSDNDTSVGKAQLINAMVNVNAKKENKTGTVYIYAYVAPNSEQESAENIVRLNKDPFQN